MAGIMASILTFAVRGIVWLLAAVGLVALVLAGMIAVPVSRPKALASIADTARSAYRGDVPPLQYFQARDGSNLAYRRYTPSGPSVNRAALLIHGSSGSSIAVHALAKALAARGVESIAPDMRGHGASGTRGDIAYLGQLDDDLADLVGHLRGQGLASPLTLAGHSSGGGFALRVAGSANQGLFARIVLLSPYLGLKSPSTRENAGGWASPNVPRIIALSVLQSFGVTCCSQLPVVAFAVQPGSTRILTSEYSFRLLQNFGTHRDYRLDLDPANGPMSVIAGRNDELMFADKYREAMQSKANIDVRVLDDANHMDVVSTASFVAVVADDLATR
jgi:pimeloyl-ACP methyl ester carboxylesterase